LISLIFFKAFMFYCFLKI